MVENRNTRIVTRDRERKSELVISALWKMTSTFDVDEVRILCTLEPLQYKNGSAF